MNKDTEWFALEVWGDKPLLAIGVPPENLPTAMAVAIHGKLSDFKPESDFVFSDDTNEFIAKMDALYGVPDYEPKFIGKVRLNVFINPVADKSFFIGQ